MKEKYEVKITKIVDEKKVECLLGDVNSLDELVANIDKFVERMRPLPEKENKEVLNFTFNGFDIKDCTLSDLRNKLIEYLVNKMDSRKILITDDIEILKILLK